MNSHHFLHRRAWVVCSALFLLAGSVLGFGGGRRSDMLWYNKTTGETAIWRLKDIQAAAKAELAGTLQLPAPSSAVWELVAVADFNLDGHPDLLWRIPASGQNSIWLMRGTTVLGAPRSQFEIAPKAAGFEATGTGDFNGDGYPDILWHNPAAHQLEVWFMEEGKYSGKSATLPRFDDSQSTPQTVADFDRDGQADILWLNPAKRKIVLWLMDGVQVRDTVEMDVRSPGKDWQVVGSGQFNPLGFSDIVWRSKTGENLLWLMHGTSFHRAVELPSVPGSAYRFSGSGGYTNVMAFHTKFGADGTFRLGWTEGTAGPVEVKRRVLGASDWTEIAFVEHARHFEEKSLTPGKVYEYSIARERVLAGLRAAPIENRGQVILAIDETVATALQPELALLKTNLVGDGWTVVQTTVPRHDDSSWKGNVQAIQSLKSFIQTVAGRAPGSLKAVFLIGHVPIPYSGSHNPDGHGLRALPADGFYGDLDGIFTDVENLPAEAGESRNNNMAGDGKFDQNRFPANPSGQAAIEVAVGRIDFAQMPCLKQSETDLLRSYLRKDDRYRRQQTAYAGDVAVGSFFPAYGTNPMLFETALRAGRCLYGLEPDSIVEADCLAPTASHLLGIIGGFGSSQQVQGATGYHLSPEMANPAREPRTAFVLAYGSYFVDWAYRDNLLRAFVGGPNYGMGAMWLNAIPNRGGYPSPFDIHFEALAFGEPIAQGWVDSINFSLAARYVPNTYIAWLGDPTLRLQVLPPPQSLKAKGGRSPELTWNSPPVERVQYFVYRSASELDGPWTRITPSALTDTTFIDDTPPSGAKLYQVRALQLTETGSGSFTNLSQGIFVRVE